MELTAIGQPYLPRVIKAFETLRLGTRGLFGTKDTRPVRLRCLPTFAHLWLLWQLPGFRAPPRGQYATAYGEPDRVLPSYLFQHPARARRDAT